MLRFPVLLLLISSLWLAGCGSGKAVGDLAFRVANTYFSDAGRDYVYRANINIGTHSLTGIFAARKVGADAHRIVLTTDFGNTLLDMEIGPKHEKINYITQNLDRRVVRKTLISDFRMLFSSGCFSTQNPNEKVFSCASDTSGTSFAQLNQNGQLVLLGSGSQRKPRVSIAFVPENDTFAHKITVSHSNIPLEIELLTLNQP